MMQLQLGAQPKGKPMANNESFGRQVQVANNEWGLHLLMFLESVRKLIAI